MENVEQYRFENGSLFEYDKNSNAYIHCYKNAFCNTKAKAVKAYEEMPEEFFTDNEWEY